MSNPFANTPARPELTEMIKKSIEDFNALPPLEQILHRLDQRKSWVIGETMLSHPEMTRNEAEAIYHKNEPDWREIVETTRAAAYRAGRIAQAREDAEILREQLADAKRQEQRVTFAIAIRAIERGRNLTYDEKMKNLMDAIAEFDREEAARVNSVKEENQNDLP